VEEAAGVVAGLIIRNDLDLVRRKGNTNLKSLKKIRIGTRTRIETKTRTEAVERTRKNPNWRKKKSNQMTRKKSMIWNRKENSMEKWDVNQALSLREQIVVSNYWVSVNTEYRASNEATFVIYDIIQCFQWCHDLIQAVLCAFCWLVFLFVIFTFNVNVSCVWFSNKDIWKRYDELAQIFVLSWSMQL